MNQKSHPVLFTAHKNDNDRSLDEVSKILDIETIELEDKELFERMQIINGYFKSNVKRLSAGSSSEDEEN